MRTLIAVVLCATAALVSRPAAAQTLADGAATAADRIAPVPFGVGERLDYQVKLGILGEVGEGYMRIDGVERIRARRTYHIDFRLVGKILFASVDTRLQSWLDVSRLHALRFKQDQKEVNYERHRVTNFFPSEMRWTRPNGESGELATPDPLDDVSFIYYARTLPLEIGETYTIPRYYKDEGNPVVIRVIGRETIEVPAGQFRTIVVQPIIQTDGLFGEGGEARLFFTDDSRRMLVAMRSKVPVIGSLRLLLKDYEEGTKLSPITSMEGSAADDDAR